MDPVFWGRVTSGGHCHYRRLEAGGGPFGFFLREGISSGLCLLCLRRQRDPERRQRVEGCTAGLGGRRRG